MSVTIHHGDSRDVLKTLADNSIDAIVCDPPYALVSIGKAGQRSSSGFMGKSWDTGETAFVTEFWAEVHRVLKPGGHVVAFGGTRTYHRLACAIEDAGFEIRDQLGWAYGSGFPKSHNVAKAIDKQLGDERAKVRVAVPKVGSMALTVGGDKRGNSRPWIVKAREAGFHEAVSPEAVSPEAVSWDGWGTALKPAWEPICLARKALDGTVAANVLKWGTGALNIDGCRVAWESEADAAAGRAAGFADSRARGSQKQSVSMGKESRSGDNTYDPAAIEGRWPANIVHDGSSAVIETFELYGDGQAARFFFSPKAASADRHGSKHPTVKPVDLMAWLCRLVTPPGGTILDPFAGSGSTGIAAMGGGFDCILIEREADYVSDIKRRLAHAAGDGLLTVLDRATDIDHAHAAGGGTPLFGGTPPPPREGQSDCFQTVRQRREIGPIGMKN